MFYEQRLWATIFTTNQIFEKNTNLSNKISLLSAWSFGQSDLDPSRVSESMYLSFSQIYIWPDVNPMCIFWNCR